MQTAADAAIQAPACAIGQKQQAILGAAREVFLESGYRAASMDGIARRANVSKQTIYSHFTSKAALFAATLRDCCEREFDVACPGDLDRLPIAEGLARLGRHYLDLVLSPTGVALFRVVVAEAPRAPELGAAFYAAGPSRVTDLVARFLDRRVARGELPPAAADCARLFLSLVRLDLHWVQLLVLDTAVDPADLDRLAVEAADMFLLLMAARSDGDAHAYRARTIPMEERVRDASRPSHLTVVG